eukprot:TRINITY_DN6237_c0_g1_i5.p1 TRINITY_DN6237_c0_g1~~TRINITY_DN6237_c0_g1_i5.p1  ORF type:complete len:221 (-),score=45.43 TRINITY_DN6237_c0_g1_i5:38-700(-)
MDRYSKEIGKKIQRPYSATLQQPAQPVQGRLDFNEGIHEMQSQLQNNRLDSALNYFEKMYNDLLINKAKNQSVERQDYYEGERPNGVRNGSGKMKYQNGQVFEGNWKEDMREGHGVLYSGDMRIVYQGEWKNDKYEGKGIVNNLKRVEFSETFDFKDLAKIGEYWDKYEGEFVNGMKHGFGTLYLTNGEKFKGQFQFDKANGIGTFYSCLLYTSPSPRDS